MDLKTDWPVWNRDKNKHSLTHFITPSPLLQVFISHTHTLSPSSVSNSPLSPLSLYLITSPSRSLSPNPLPPPPPPSSADLSCAMMSGRLELMNDSANISSRKIFLLSSSIVTPRERTYSLSSCEREGRGEGERERERGRGRGGCGKNYRGMKYM